MKKNLPTLAVLCSLVIVTFSGCVSTSESTTKLVGQPSKELLDRWGEPQQKTPDGSGGEIWTYLEQRKWTTPGQPDTTLPATGTPYGRLYGNPLGTSFGADTSEMHTSTAQRMFFVNSRGIIYRYEWKAQ